VCARSAYLVAAVGRSASPLDRGVKHVPGHDDGARGSKNLAKEGIVEDELTRLALQYPPPDDAPTPHEVGSSALRSRPFFIAFFGLMTMLFLTLFVAVSRRLDAHGDKLICRAAGCRSLSTLVAVLGFLALLSAMALISSLIKRE
jgi:hypothetical protein